MENKDSCACQAASSADCWWKATMLSLRLGGLQKILSGALVYASTVQDG